MFDSVEKKILVIKSLFQPCKDQASHYEQIIQMGTWLPEYKKSRDSSSLVEGCQSKLYLVSELNPDSTITFYADSDALITRGLVWLMLSVYNGERPEIILKHQPTFLSELGIFASLSPSRSNGLSSLHLQMKKLALNYLLTISTK